MSEVRPDYHSFLLRLWLDDGEEQPTWRASLEGSLGDQAIRFASLEDLFAFLRQETGTAYETTGSEAAPKQQPPAPPA